MIDDVTTKGTMVKEGTRRASISSDLKPWPDWFTTLYLFFAHLMLLQDTVISNWCLSYYSVWIWNRKWFITTTSLKKVHQGCQGVGRITAHWSDVGVWMLGHRTACQDIAPFRPDWWKVGDLSVEILKQILEHYACNKIYCPLSTRSMESWGFICPDSTRSADPDSDAAQNAIKII